MNTILIVEDEAIVRFELIDFFEDEGYRVFEAENADDAIAVLERNSTIRIVLTDIDMPGSMDGLKLAHYIRKRYPPTLLLIASGRVSVSQSELPDYSVFLSKPFDPTRLMRTIDDMTR
ncbi:response regulator [Sphingomonas sp. KR1UV-12]|uniref:Response regulator n=1 Tax=Sphingomonas aurea TaxID=3063994 RepID=A0ABT9EJP3_9SPHN|nr:response regulator [Sphingomonas sp. KR1UV-12]MDP1026858.1 response regulator [Sphingomonas sp. KR1UV-12]